MSGSIEAIAQSSEIPAYPTLCKTESNDNSSIQAVYQLGANDYDRDNIEINKIQHKILTPLPKERYPSDGDVTLVGAKKPISVPSHINVDIDDGDFSPNKHLTQTENRNKGANSPIILFNLLPKNYQQRSLESLHELHPTNSRSGIEDEITTNTLKKKLFLDELDKQSITLQEKMSLLNNDNIFPITFIGSETSKDNTPADIPESFPKFQNNNIYITTTNTTHDLESNKSTIGDDTIYLYEKKSYHASM